MVSWSQPRSGMVSTGVCPARGCSFDVVVHQTVADRYWKKGETFYCPAGHGQSFNPHRRETEARLRREAQAAEEAAAEARLAKDRASRTCPWPTCDGRLLASERGLRQHMVKAHGAPWSMPEVSADEIGQVLNGQDPAEVVR